MKKMTLIMAASASMLLAAPAMDGNMTTMQGYGCKAMKMQSNCNCKGRMMNQGKKSCNAMSGMGMKGNNMMPKRKMMDNSPFLIERGLPHMSKMLMKNWEDPALALSAEQRTSLSGIMKETMTHIFSLKQEILPLKKNIVSAALSGSSAAELKEKVEKLAQLEAEATMVQIKCLEETKSVLSKDQLIYLFSNNAHKNRR